MLVEHKVLPPAERSKKCWLELCKMSIKGMSKRRAESQRAHAGKENTEQGRGLHRTLRKGEQCG